MSSPNEYSNLDCLLLRKLKSMKYDAEQEMLKWRQDRLVIHQVAQWRLAVSPHSAPGIEHSRIRALDEGIKINKKHITLLNTLIKTVDEYIKKQEDKHL